MKMVFEIRLDVTEKEISQSLKHLGSNYVKMALDKLKKHKPKENDVWFHRELELPFLPVAGMTFEFELLHEEGCSDFAPFIAQEVKWYERNGGYILVWFRLDQWWDNVYPHSFNTELWQVGPFNGELHDLTINVQRRV